MINGRVAIVTGAARGIGAAVASRLADDGFRVALLDRDLDGVAATAAALVDSGCTARGYGVDVIDEERVVDVVAEIADELGPPAVLVNNAGVIRDNLLFKMTSDDWDVVLSVHLRGAFLMTREAQKFMTAAGWGRIVNLSSTSALGNRGQVNYSAAKAGMQGFTKTLAIELGRYGVTANAIAPGFIATDMTRATAERVGVDFDEFVASAITDIPVGRVGTPADIAALVSYLAAEESGFVSGQVIYAAGGPKG